MSMERRERQRSFQSKRSSPGHRADKTRINLELELQRNSWLRIGLVAKHKEVVFNNLLQHFNVETLREAFHALDGSKAVGSDGISKHQYSLRLEENLRDLVQRIHRQSYRPQPKRGTFIPKANGKKRPIAISSFEDKLVEWVLAKILSTVFEPLFIRNSFGFRPRHSAHDAIKASYLSLKDNKRPHVVEMDLANFFDTVSHRRLMRYVKKRISDRRLLGLIARFLQAGILDQTGNIAFVEIGTPQGSVMSPVLANVFLHQVLDTWFLENYASKDAIIVRYADDAVFYFKSEKEASAFANALQERMAEKGLKLNEDKSGKVSFTPKSGKVFSFLGFTFFWGKEKSTSRRILKVKTEKKRLAKSIQAFTAWIKEARSRLKLDDIWKQTAAKLRGHYNYYGMCSNRPKMNHFYYAVTGQLFKWLNRRSQRKSFTGQRFQRRLRFNPLPTPPVVSALKPLDNRRRYAF